MEDQLSSYCLRCFCILLPNSDIRLRLLRNFNIIQQKISSNITTTALFQLTTSLRYHRHRYVDNAVMSHMKKLTNV